MPIGPIDQLQSNYNETEELEPVPEVPATGAGEGTAVGPAGKKNPEEHLSVGLKNLPAEAAGAVEVLTRRL